MILRFGPFELDEGLYALRRDGRDVEIQPKALDLLLYLVHHRDRLVSKEELLERLWPDVVVNDEVLSRAVHAARAALGDDGERQCFIQTVRRRGFRFVASVRDAEAAAPTPAEEPGSFVGRASTLATLEAALDHARAGRGRIALLGGEAGIGKTRTLEAFASRARRKGARVLSGWCYEGEGAPPYWPWVQILRAATQACDRETLRTLLGAGASDVARILPGLAEQLGGLPEPPPLRPEQARFRLFDAITEFLKNATAREPHVLLVDDLHWADASSLLLIEFLARELATARLLLVGTCEERGLGADHPLAATLGALARSDLCERIDLEGLGERDAARLVALASGNEPPPELVAALLEKTEGNPFLLTEIARLLESEAGGGREGATSARVALPRGVKEVVARRLARLSPGSRRALAVAAVMGREFEPEALSRVLDDAAAAASGVDEAVAAGLLVDERRAGRARFSHELIRDVLYDELESDERQRLHRRVGEVLEQVHAVDVAPHLPELARHFLRAPDAEAGEKAIAYAVRAGESATAQTAYEEAADYYERAHGLAARRERALAQLRCELLLSAAEARRRAGDLGVARETFLEAAVLARRLPAPELLARVALGVGPPFTPFEVGAVDHVEVQLLEEALDAQTLRGSGLLRAQLLARLSVALHWAGDARRSGELADEAYAEARRSGEPATLAQALKARYMSLLRTNRFAERLPVANQMVRYAEEAGDRELAVVCRLVRLIERLEVGDADPARAELEALERRADALRQPAALWYASVARANWALLEGSLAEAEERAREALEVGERLGDPNVQMAFAMQTFAQRREQGALETLEEPVKGFAGRYPNAVFWRSTLAWLHAQLGRDEEARAEFEAVARRGFDSLARDLAWPLCMAQLAELCAHFGDARRAEELERLVRPHRGRQVAIAVVDFLGPVDRYLGLLAAARERVDEAGALFESASESAERMGARPWEARSRLDHARTLLRRGGPDDPGRVRELLARAAEAARGLPALANAAAELQREAG